MSEIVVKEIKDDLDLKNYTLDNLSLLSKLRTEYFKIKPEVCIERSLLMTRHLKKTENSGLPMQLRRAMAIGYYLSKRKPLFLDDNMLAGNSTSKLIGAPVYPELLTGLSVWPELDTISTRKSNPLILSEKDAETLNLKVYPYWLDRTVLEVLRKETGEIDPSTGKMKDEYLYNTIALSEKLVFFLPGKPAVISHTTPYYEEMLAVGVNGIIKKAKEKERALRDSGKTDDETKTQIIFYQSMQTVLQGVIKYAKNLSKEALKLAKKEKNQARRENLLAIGEVCARVPADPPSTFREACNAVWICHASILGENVNQAMNPGRLDQILYPFFKKDVEAGKLSVKEALSLIGSLWFKIGDNTNLVPEASEQLFGGAGSVPAITLGGIKKDGTDAVNDLTYLMLRVTELLRIKDPNVNARYYHGVNEEAYRDRVSRVVMNTKAIPAFYNDESNIATLVNQGISLEHARDYSIIGCVELSSGGREYNASSAALINLTAPLIMTLNNGKRPFITGSLQIGPQTGDPETFKSYDEFWNAFAAQVKSLSQKAIDLNNALGICHQKFVPTPLLSSFFVGPMEKGKDLIFGGAMYNSSGITHIGFADVCDSLNAVEYAVFVDKQMTMKDMLAAVNTNFAAPYDKYLPYLKKQCPKYGTEHEIAKRNSEKLIQLIYEFYQSKENYRGGKYRPAYWTMTNHAGLGRVTKEALPSGRQSYEVFSSGITPASQAADQLTVAFGAVAGLGYDTIPGGLALNMKYSPYVSNTDYEKYLKDFSAMIEGYFEKKGMQVQFNIQDYQTLIDAKNHPEKYPELLVRVSGYSAFFKDLNEAMKDELITRTQYNLATGQAVPLPTNDK
jgi:pyruvate formate-lyase/glycerol dehydratase family glycyl radical enzyme